MSAFLRTVSRATAVPTAARAFSSTAPRPLARITIVGNLAASPELKAASTGKDYMRYTVASNTGYGENRVGSFFNITAFEAEGARRDFLLSLPKGTLVYVEGDASMGAYEDAEGKIKRPLNIVQRQIEVLRRPDSEAGHGGEGKGQ